MKIWPFVAPIVFLCACQTKQSVWLSPRQYQVPRLQEDARYSHSDSGDAAPFVRQSEVVKVYGINRYVDPGDSRILHERHAIYRLEQQPTWTTRSPHNQNEVILGPIVGLRKPEYAPEPLPGETARELGEVRRSTQQADQEVNAIREGQARLASNIETLAKETVAAQRTLTSAVSVLNHRVGRLENSGSREEQTAAGAGDSEDSGVVIHAPNP